MLGLAKGSPEAGLGEDLLWLGIWRLTRLGQDGAPGGGAWGRRESQGGRQGLARNNCHVVLRSGWASGGRREGAVLAARLAHEETHAQRSGLENLAGQ